jgi:hypothetical protein
MMWTTIAPALLAAVQGIALQPSDPLWVAEWQDEQRTFGSPTAQVKVFLEVTSCAPVFDATRTTADGLGSPIQTAHAIREFVLNVQVKSYDSTYAFWAFEYAERIRTRMNRDTVLEALAAVETKFLRASPITRLEYNEDGHAIKVANLDLFMRAGFVDEAESGIGWIDSVALTSKLRKPDGTLYDSPPNYTDLILPPV